MQKILCPVCKADLNLCVKENLKVDFDMRKATQKTWCNNCKRYIKYNIETTESK